jgi:aldehyde:ferredoxin oxidoreductase
MSRVHPEYEFRGGIGMTTEKSDRIYAIAGKILRVNLSNGEIRTEPSERYHREWVGASGIAIKLLYDELGTWVEPFSPANKLILSAGSLLGTPAPGANKMCASTLSPMTGGGGSSHADSYFGAQLKYAGYDVLVIEGRASKPVYLWIHDRGEVEICDASVIWGMTTWKTLDMIRQLHHDEDLHAISIGPAGENLVRGACIIQDKGRAMGRCGTGSVMGSKNLKAVVAKGTGFVDVADKKRFLAAVVANRKNMVNHPAAKNLRKYGSLGILEAKQACSGINYKNFQENCFPKDVVNQIDPRKSVDKYQVRRVSFPGCGVGGCGRWMYITEGPYAGLKTEACQWEAMSTLQGRFAVHEPTFAFKANAYCNEMGLDIDSSAGAIGWAMECYQRGIIDELDTDGLKLQWGDSGVVLELMRRITYREGFGNILAEGSARAAQIVGRDSGYYAIHQKGQDLYENIRGANAWALGTTTSTRGGGHTTGAIWFETVGGLNVEKAKKIFGVDSVDKPLEYGGKAEMVKYQEVLHRISNCLGICIYNTISFNMDFMDLPECAELYSAATGVETSVEDFKRLATKQINLEKAFNLRFTEFDRKDDLPPSRELREPIVSGPLKGWKIDEEKYNKMLDDYYDLHGWDRETSFPKRQTLMDLGLEYVANDLERIGKLR